jgi:hypothetical protein
MLAMLEESLQVIHGIDVSPGSQELCGQVIPRQYLGSLLQYRPGTPSYAAECLGKQAVVTEPDKVITAVNGRANDAVEGVEKAKGIGDDFQGEIGNVAADEDSTVKAHGEGITEAALHSLAEIVSSLGKVMEVLTEEGFKTRKGILRMSAYEQGKYFSLES